MKQDDQHWGDIARSDWGSAVVVALVLSIATAFSALEALKNVSHPKVEWGLICSPAH